MTDPFWQLHQKLAQFSGFFKPLQQVVNYRNAFKKFDVVHETHLFSRFLSTALELYWQEALTEEQYTFLRCCHQPKE